MKRRIWLILAMAILFGIEAPLCALACVEAGAPQITAPGSEAIAGNTSRDKDLHHRSQPPCHESKSDSSPADSPESHQDCGCNFAVEGLLSDSSGTATSFVMGWTGSGAVVGFVAAEDVEAWKATFESDIPPPDLLLLKSTLLI